jgi:FixJ family two-component response regulator
MRTTVDRGTGIGLVAIVDDDFSVRRALSRLFRSEGWSVEVYPSAEAFLAGRNGHPYSVLLVDVALEQMSGIDLLEHLDAEGPVQPAVLITAHPSDAVRERAARLGAAVLIKPVESTVLLAAVVGAIGRDPGEHAE